MVLYGMSKKGQKYHKNPLTNTVRTPTGCLEWQGSKAKRYGSTTYKGKYCAIHRKVWMLTQGAIPDGLFVLHKCDNPICCNPEHLFLGTQTDNMRDMAAKGRASKGRPRVTHCSKGHEYTDENSYWLGKSRWCRICVRAKVAAHQAKKAAK